MPLALAARRRRLDVLRPRGDTAEWAALALPIAVTAVLGLLPVIHADGFSFGNDTYTYGAFSEWLQHRAFSEAARWEPQSPVTSIPFLYQSQHYDLGIAHWLALVQAAVRPASVLLVYPSTSAWALVLLVSTLWLATRQLLRLGPGLGRHRRAGGRGRAACALLGPSQRLPAAGLRVAARRLRPRAARALHARALGCGQRRAPGVAVRLPRLGLPAARAALRSSPRQPRSRLMLLRARRRGQLRRLATLRGCDRACVAALRDARPAERASAASRLRDERRGRAHPLGRGRLPRVRARHARAGAGLGQRETSPPGARSTARSPRSTRLSSLAGLWHAARRPRTRPFAAAAGLARAAARSTSRSSVKDPWSGERGHTWNLFKLAQWGWPFALLLAVLAVRRLAPQRPRLAHRRARRSLSLLPASQVGVHWPWSRRLGEAMREILPGTTLAAAASAEAADPGPAARNASPRRPAGQRSPLARDGGLALRLPAGGRRRLDRQRLESRCTRTAARRSMRRCSRAGTTRAWSRSSPGCRLSPPSASSRSASASRGS